ncbi:MAG TPA: GTP-binding protein [Prolixibacteraceae bacterium]|nr:GTP-binding protein [Prolixibacteraceae bacterium]
MKNEQRIPVTIITGFLGAGKTSLLNKLIKKHPEKKFAIIENEFGETGIDGALITTASDAIFELSNGCICCSLGEDFLFTLENLLGSSYAFDHLLIETTGIADPSSIIDAFVSGESIQTRFRIDSVVCVADAVNMEDLMDEQFEVRKQLALSDLILINKTDSVHPDYVNDLTRTIAQISPLAKIYPTSFANVDAIDMIDIQTFAGESIEKSTLSFWGMANPETRENEPGKAVMNPSKAINNTRHDIRAEGFSFTGNFEVNKFGLWIQNFLYFNKETIFRVKGIVSFQDTPDQFIFHAVRGSFMFEVGKEWKDEPRFSKLVFIGKNISRTDLEANLRQLLVKE